MENQAGHFQRQLEAFLPASELSSDVRRDGEGEATVLQMQWLLVGAQICETEESWARPVVQESILGAHPAHEMCTAQLYSDNVWPCPITRHKEDISAHQGN